MSISKYIVWYRMSISNDLKYNSYEYDKYDKYDIIDFLEQEYIKDWLSIIPNSVWIKNKKVIEIVFAI